MHFYETNHFIFTWTVNKNIFSSHSCLNIWFLVLTYEPMFFCCELESHEVLIYIPLINNYINYFLCTCWQFICLL